MARTRIKICGVRDVETALLAAEAGADAIGLIFVRSSPRLVMPEQAQEIMLALPPMVASVGVFMNHSIEAFSDIEEQCPTTHTQLHGNEDEKLVAQCGPAIKAVRFDPTTIAADLARWEACDAVEAILLDSPTPGEGVAFEWSQLVPLMDAVTKPIFLAGGLTPENVGDAIRVVRPYAVDVSSGVERERGVKDHDLIEAFCDAVGEADAE